jgi:hypothetical protein
MLAHVRKEHKDDTMFKCKVEGCTAAFQTKRLLVGHARSAHESTKRKKLSLEDKSWLSLAGLLAEETSGRSEVENSRFHVTEQDYDGVLQHDVLNAAPAHDILVTPPEHDLLDMQPEHEVLSAASTTASSV